MAKNWTQQNMDGACVRARALGIASERLRIDLGGAPSVMFPEMTKDLNTKIVTADESLAGQRTRDVYLPKANGMAHRSYLFPGFQVGPGSGSVEEKHGGAPATAVSFRLLVDQRRPSKVSPLALSSAAKRRLFTRRLPGCISRQRWKADFTFGDKRFLDGVNRANHLWATEERAVSLYLHLMANRWLHRWFPAKKHSVGHDQRR